MKSFTRKKKHRNNIEQEVKWGGYTTKTQKRLLVTLVNSSFIGIPRLLLRCVGINIINYCRDHASQSITKEMCVHSPPQARAILLQFAWFLFTST